jgi:hypothetical protein
MKKIRIVIISMVFIALLLQGLSSVVATDATIVLTDDRGDVEDENQAIVDKPNLDILELTIQKTGKTLSLELVVDGEIENRGTILLFQIISGQGDFSELNDTELYEILLNTSFDFVGYMFQIVTDMNEYSVFYVNEEIIVMDTISNESITATYSVQTNTLLISFELTDEDENLDDSMIMATTYELLGDFMEGTIYGDDIFSIALEIDLDVPNVGEVDKNVQFYGYGFGGTEPYIFEWDFGDGETSTEQNPVHTYASEGEYTYTLTVTDALGADETESGTIEIIGESADTPGFGVLIAFVALGLLLWLKKKQ